MSVIKKKTGRFKYYFLRWVTHWIQIVEGVCGVVSLGFFNPIWSLRALSWELDAADACTPRINGDKTL